MVSLELVAQLLLGLVGLMMFIFAPRVARYRAALQKEWRGRDVSVRRLVWIYRVFWPIFALLCIWYLQPR